jgi:hypothetical protein
VGNIDRLRDGTNRLKSKALGKNRRDCNGNGVFATSIGLNYWNNGVYNRKSELFGFNEIER